MLEEWLNFYFYQEYERKNLVPKILKSDQNNITNKAIFYNTVNVNTKYDIYADWIIITITFQFQNREQTVQWQGGITRDKCQNIHTMTEYLSPMLKQSFGSFPKTKAARVFYGI